jgi:hypothetical protein
MNHIETFASTALLAVRMYVRAAQSTICDAELDDNDLSSAMTSLPHFAASILYPSNAGPRDTQHDAGYTNSRGAA